MEDDFFFSLPSPVALSLAHPTLCPTTARVLLGRALRGHVSAFPQPSSTQSAVCPGSGTRLPSVSFCVGVRAHISAYVEEAQVRAFGLADVKPALFSLSSQMRSNNLTLLTTINSVYATQVTENIFQRCFGDYFFFKYIQPFFIFSSHKSRHWLKGRGRLIKRAFEEPSNRSWYSQNKKKPMGTSLEE